MEALVPGQEILGFSSSWRLGGRSQWPAFLCPWKGAGGGIRPARDCWQEAAGLARGSLAHERRPPWQGPMEAFTKVDKAVSWAVVLDLTRAVKLSLHPELSVRGSSACRWL